MTNVYIDNIVPVVIKNYNFLPYQPGSLPHVIDNYI